MIGIAISYSKKLLIYPPSYKNCPDYWTEGDGTPGNGEPGHCLYPYVSTYKNRGSEDFVKNNNNALPNNEDYLELNKLAYIVYGNTNTTPLPINSADPIHKYYIKMNGNDASWNTIYGNAYAGLTARCAKRKWAIENGIVWDGITNYNGCS